MAALENDNDRGFADFLPAFFVLLVGAIFGGSMVFVTPPFDAPEEPQHFHRSYQCSQGTIWATRNGQTSGGDMPLSLRRVHGLSIGAPRNENELQVSVHDIKEALALPLDPQAHDFVGFPVTSRYSPVCYLPSAAAIAIGRCARLTALRELYIGRAGTLIGYLLLVIAAIWLTPVQKWSMALVALMPTSIFLAASLSADALSIAISLLAISMILRAALQGGIAGPRGLCGLGAVLAALALVKPGYVLISFLFLSVPAERFSSRAACRRVRAMMIGMPLALSAAWVLSIRDLNLPLRPGVNMHAQAQWMFEHPGEYLKLLVGGLTRLDVYGRAIATLGWGTIFLRTPLYWTLLGRIGGNGAVGWRSPTKAPPAVSAPGFRGGTPVGDERDRDPHLPGLGLDRGRRDRGPPIALSCPGPAAVVAAFPRQRQDRVPPLFVLARTGGDDRCRLDRRRRHVESDDREVLLALNWGYFPSHGRSGRVIETGSQHGYIDCIARRQAIQLLRFHQLQA